MLYDALPLDLRYEDGQVDAEAAMEFMKEATKLASTSELEDLGQRLEEKSRVFRELLARERVDTMDEADFKRLLGMIFSVRRKGGRLLRRHGLEHLRAELRELVHGENSVEERFERFVANVDGLEQPMIVSIASECLHYTDPQRYWLWTHWILNPGTGAGALPLVVQGDGVLSDFPPRSPQGDGVERPGEVYVKVGRAMAAVDDVGHRCGFSRSGRGLFGTDVFLAAVYAVYMYTVFRVKLSQEFNRILPELPEIVERVLGIRQLGIRRQQATGETHG